MVSHDEEQEDEDGDDDGHGVGDGDGGAGGIEDFQASCYKLLRSCYDPQMDECEDGQHPLHRL